VQSHTPRRVGRHRPRGGPQPDPRRPVRRGAGGRRRHHSQGLPGPRGRRAGRRPRLAALPIARRHQPHLLRVLRPPAHGPLRRHAGRLRPGQGEERRPRTGQPLRPLPQGGHRGGGDVEPGGVGAVASPDICATSDGAAAVVVSSLDFAARHAAAPAPGAGGGRIHGHAPIPEHRHRDAELRHRLQPGVGTARPRLRDSIAAAAYEQAGLGPPTSTWPRSTTSPPLWSSTGTRTSACAGPARPRSSCATARPRWAGASP